MPDLMSTDGNTPCESCGRRRPLVGVRFPQTDDEFHVCRQCAVVGIRTHGVTEVELRFPVGPAVWCPCWGTPEPEGSWIMPDDSHDDHWPPAGAR